MFTPWTRSSRYNDNTRVCVLQVNLSPALGNDCDVDSQVKKPLLHDTFDLLGLPMRNTGLSSLFRVACRSASGPRYGGRRCALAAAATEKWKSKRTAANKQHRDDDDDDDATVTTSARQPSPHCGGKAQRGGGGRAGQQPPPPPPAADVLCNSPVMSPVWGNGRDWRRPVDSEGDWVRVFPFVPAAAATAAARSARPRAGRASQQFAAAENDATRAVIKNVQEYLRCCKKVARSCEGLSGVTDDELNDKLKDLFPAATNTWLPPN